MYYIYIEYTIMKRKYEETKQSIMKWRSNNIEKYRETQMNYYNNNKDKCNKARQKRRVWAKIAQTFRNILIDI